MLVGINHEPTPDGVKIAELERRIESAARSAGGAVCLNLLRLTNKRTRAHVKEQLSMHKVHLTHLPARKPNPGPWWLPTKLCDLSFCAPGPLAPT